MMMSTKEFTWGGELSKIKEEIEWSPVEEEEDEDILFTHCLFLKQAVLGEDAKEGERNIVEVETRDWNNRKIIQPILSLKLNLNECCPLDLTLLPPVKLRLTCGSGPVFLAGTHAMEIEDDEDYIGDSSLEGYGLTPDQKSKKRPASAVKGAAKKRKVENGTDEDEDDEEDESEGEDEEEEDEDEEDGAEEDGEEEGDDEEEEEDEDDESMEEDDEDSSPEKTKRKSRKSKPNGKDIVNGASKKKGKGKGKKMNLEEIKKELTTQGSGKHKKEEKFTNMVRSKYHMTDAKKLQDLWTWYKGTQLAK